MQDKLQRINFDDYIYQNFVEFLRQEGNHNETEDGGLYLKEDVEFYPSNIVNRNEKISDQLWKAVVFYHLRYLNYN
jgi:hypothetical protein